MDEGGQYLYKSNMENLPKSGGIQNFNLFGESADLPDVVHCETIGYRSRLHNWELFVHRHPRLHQILLVESGGGTIDVDGTRSSFNAGTCINLPAGTVHGFDFSPETEGWVVTLATEILDETLVTSEGLGPHLQTALVLPDCLKLRPYVEQLFAEYAAQDFGRAQVLRSLCGVVMGLVAREAVEADRSEDWPHEYALFRRFTTLVERHFLDHWAVALYADALAVTPGHLSRVCRRAAGVSASGIKLERAIREARRLLTYTNLSISQIAYELGYIDPAYFSRVFSKACGKSPRDFRAGLESDVV